MDDFDLQGASMRVLLTDLKTVNKWLGGNSVTMDGISKLLDETPQQQQRITILDIGCGDGEVLRQCEAWATKNEVAIRLVGVDANPHIIEEAKKRSHGIKNTTFMVVDIFAEKEKLPPHDIALCTLFAHHFKEAQIVQLMQKLENEAKIGVVVNDLHRSRWAFWLFRLFSIVFLKTKIARHDGLVSVARGFKKQELVAISKHIHGKHQIQWKWAFRYQWIIKSNN
jgi:SAM-dependent methyltransferase